MAITFVAADVLTQAGAIVTAFMPIIVLALGVKYGGRVAKMFTRM